MSGTSAALIGVPLPLDSEESQAPQLDNIALRRSEGTERFGLEAIIVYPGPNFTTEQSFIGVDGVPKAIVRIDNLASESCILAKV